MEKSLIEQEKEIDWYISQNPIEKYLKIDRVDNHTVSKFVCIKSGKHFYRERIKQSLRQKIE